MKKKIDGTIVPSFGTVFGMRAASSCILLLVSPLAPADTLDIGAAADFAVLALNDGILSINSATTVEGIVGAAKNVTVHQAQKIETFDGQAMVYSGNTTTTFDETYAADTFAPSGGISYGPGAVDATLEQANADASKAAIYYASLRPTRGPNVLGIISSDLSLTGSGGMNAYSVSTWTCKSTVLTLTGSASDMFVFNITGSMNWAQSAVVLNGIDENQVVFNFVGRRPNAVLIYKSETVFKGTILSLNVPVIYHNPASFIGRIIARDISLHSAFNITGPPPPSLPALPVMPPTGELGITNNIFLKDVVIPVSYSITRRN